ncbi:MAG: TonB-dependent receptor plug domain-containing protein, partial [Bacteroidota bacterium]
MKITLLSLLSTILYFSPLAQITVNGTILNASDQTPIIGASILEQDTGNGTISDVEGRFQLEVAEDASLSISYLGYEPKVVEVLGQTRLEILLSEKAQTLEGVVVTAFGIEKEKKAAGFSFSEIDGESLTKAREVNVAAQLVGKVAGLEITKPSNGPAGSTRIIIRGLSQFQGENRPLIVIDGIPSDNSNVNRAGLFGGRDSGDGLSALNPDDIETITVLKGPSAAALYGSRAGNGVVLVTTKKGSQRKGVGVEFTSNFVVEEVTVLPNFQEEYGQGANGEKPTSQQEAFDNWRSWGARLDGSLTPIFNGESLPYTAVGQDDIRSYYQRGSTLTNSLALTAGGEKINTRLSLSALSNTAIIPNTAYDRYTINLSTRAQLSDKVSIEGKINYVAEEAENRTNLTDNPSNPSKYFTIGPANLPQSVFQQTRNELGEPIYWS